MAFIGSFRGWVVPGSVKAARRLLAAALLVASVACHGNSGVAPSGPFSITGTVTDVNHSPVINATVMIAGGPNAGRTTKTSANPPGSYGFSGLYASGFTITVVSKDWAPTSVIMTLPGDLVADVVMKYPAYVMTGHVMDADSSAPIPNAVVDLNSRYRTVADAKGAYTLTAGLDGGNNGNDTSASADGYEPEYRFVIANSRDFHLRRSERIAAGASVPVTVAPTDTICVNNVQDDPFLYGQVFPVCRTVRVVVPSGGGLLTVEVVSAGGAHPDVEEEVLVGSNSAVADMANPWSQQVPAGAEVIVNVEIPSSSTTSRTFTLKTSISGSPVGSGQTRTLARRR